MFEKAKELQQQLITRTKDCRPLVDAIDSSTQVTSGVISATTDICEVELAKTFRAPGEAYTKRSSICILLMVRLQLLYVRFYRCFVVYVVDGLDTIVSSW